VVTGWRAPRTRALKRVQESAAHGAPPNSLAGHYLHSLYCGGTCGAAPTRGRADVPYPSCSAAADCVAVHPGVTKAKRGDACACCAVAYHPALSSVLLPLFMQSPSMTCGLLAKTFSGCRTRFGRATRLGLRRAATLLPWFAATASSLAAGWWHIASAV